MTEPTKTKIPGELYEAAGLAVKTWRRRHWFREVSYLEIFIGDRQVFSTKGPSNQVSNCLWLLVFGLNQGRLAALDESCWQQLDDFLESFPESGIQPVFSFRYQSQAKVWVAEIQNFDGSWTWDYAAPTIAAAIRGVIQLVQKHLSNHD